MIITVNIPTDIKVAAVRVVVPVDDEDLQSLREDAPSIPIDRQLDPGVDEGKLSLLLDLDTGKVRFWPGKPAKVHLKVRDGGAYTLLDADLNTVSTREGEYVPDFFPGEHYGDYLILDIADDGTVMERGRPWAPKPKDVADYFDVEGTE